MVLEKCQLLLPYPCIIDQELPERVSATNPSAEQVVGEPAPLVLELRLVGEHTSAEDLAEVIRLHQLGVWIDTTNPFHGEHDAPALMQQSPGERLRVARVGIPVAVETTE